MNPKIVEDKPISMYEVAEEIKHAKKKYTEVPLVVTKTEEYVAQFTPLKKADVDALEKELTELNIPRLKEGHIKKIIDLLPVNVEELRVIFQGLTVTISKENMQQIVSTVEKYHK